MILNSVTIMIINVKNKMKTRKTVVEIVSTKTMIKTG